MRVAIINSSLYGMKPSDRIYNLAVHKIANYHILRGDEVVATERWEPAHHREAAKFYFSVLFTWDIPKMIQAVQQVVSWGKEVEIGGPAATFMHQYIAKETGIYPHIGLDDRFEFVPGKYKMAFTSRGCPHGCPFCGVKRVEPVYMEYPDFWLASTLGDNNILATSWEHQVMVVDKLATLKGKVDINSGFDVRFFQKKHYDLYSRLHLTQWRFAFDSMDVWDDVWRVGTMMRNLGWDRHHVMFYCLIGFPGQSPEEARFRLDTVRDLGHNPYPMRFIPINSLSHKYVAPGWTEDILFRLSTYYQSPNIWKTCSWQEFTPGKNIVNIPSEQGVLDA